MPITFLIPLVASRVIKPRRNHTVHWATGTARDAALNVKTTVNLLKSTNWEDQHRALQDLISFFERALSSKEPVLQTWTCDQLQLLCSGLLHAASSPRSQVYHGISLNDHPPPPLSLDFSNVDFSDKSHSLSFNSR